MEFGEGDGGMMGRNWGCLSWRFRWLKGRVWSWEVGNSLVMWFMLMILFCFCMLYGFLLSVDSVERVVVGYGGGVGKEGG